MNQQGAQIKDVPHLNALKLELFHRFHRRATGWKKKCGNYEVG
jgi:hypothetical protein